MNQCIPPRIDIEKARSIALWKMAKRKPTTRYLDHCPDLLNPRSEGYLLHNFNVECDEFNYTARHVDNETVRVIDSQLGNSIANK